MAKPQTANTVREARYAGSWYPSGAAVLRTSIEGYLATVEPAQLPARPLALVCPHAGHRYSGPVAAHAYAQVRGAAIRRVVLMGPLHRIIFGSALGDIMAPAETAYATPLGAIPVDTTFIAALSRRVPLTVVRRDQEHSLEIELPFLQVALEGFTLAPLMMAADIENKRTPALLEELATSLAELADEHTLFVASTDLSHLNDYREVARVDAHMAELVNAFDVPALTSALSRGEVKACGATGLVTALRAAQLMGAQGARVLRLTSSAEITGERQLGAYTVGYMAAAAF